MDKEKQPLPPRSRGWLYAIGVFGAILVCLSTVIYHINTGISVLGYVIGFFCLLLGAAAMFSKRDET